MVPAAEVKSEKEIAILKIIEACFTLFIQRSLPGANHLSELLVKSVCNMLATGTKIMVTSAQMYPLIASFHAQMNDSNSKPIIFAGLTFIDMLMSEVAFGSHLYGYFNFSLMIAEMKNQLMDKLHEIAWYSAAKLSQSLGQELETEAQTGIRSNPQEVQAIAKLTSVAFECLYKVYNFPFDNSYITFCSDQDLSEQSMNSFPMTWSTKIFDFGFLSQMQALIGYRAIPEDIRVGIIKVIAMLASAKMDHTLSGESGRIWMKFHLLFPSHVLKHYEVSNTRISLEVLEHLIDQIGRTHKIHRVFKLSKLKEEFTVQIESLNVLSRHIFQQAYEVRHIASHT